MTRRRGFALLAAVFAVVLMAMVVAINAQRALVAARQGTLSVAQAELAWAVAGARSGLFELPADSVNPLLRPPGAVIARGETVSGGAHSQWLLVQAAASVATVEITAQARAFGGTAHWLERGLVAPARDSMGGRWWALVGGAGWVQMPSP